MPNQLQQSNNTLILNLSLPEKHLRVRIPPSMTLSKLQSEIKPYLFPDEKNSTNEFTQESDIPMKPRDSLSSSNPFLQSRTPMASSFPISTTIKIESMSDYETQEDHEGLNTLYLCQHDVRTLSEVKENPKQNIAIKRNMENSDQEYVFVYKGEILDFERPLSDYSITEYSTIFYGKPRKVTFRNLAQNKMDTFYTTSETLAGELREMLGKMGMLDPQEELLFNSRTLSDNEIPEISSQNNSISQDEIKLESKRKVMRVLSIDGGGIRGIAVATILEEIEAATNKRIHELFDVIVGTSTGGLLALMMTIPTKEGTILTAKEAKEVYISRRYEMFKKNPWFMNSLAHPKYTGEGIESVVKEIYGDNTIRKAVKPMGVVATDYDLHKPILINSMRAQIHEDDYRHNLPVWKAVRATSAAPTFFPPIVIGCDVAGVRKRSVSPTKLNDLPSYSRGSIRLEDGGTTMNNPTLLAIKYAHKLLTVTGNSFDYDIQVVSLGTGNLLGYESPPPIIKGNGSLLNFVSKFTEDPLFITRNTYNIHNQVMNDYFDGREGPGSGYFRVQFKISKIMWQHMDTCDLSNIKGLINAAKFYIYSDGTTYSNHFKGLLDLLRDNVPRPTLKFDYNCPNCRVGTRFFMFLSDYFSHQKFSKKVPHPTLLRDLFECLKFIDSTYPGPIMKPRLHKKWLLSMLKDHLGRKIADSIINFIHTIADHILVRLPDRAEKDFEELKRFIVNLDYDSTLEVLQVKGSFGEVFQTKERLYKNLAKIVRKALLDSQLYRDICGTAKSILEEVGTRIRKTYTNVSHYNEIC